MSEFLIVWMLGTCVVLGMNAYEMHTYPNKKVKNEKSKINLLTIFLIGGPALWSFFIGAFCWALILKSKFRIKKSAKTSKRPKFNAIASAR